MTCISVSEIGMSIHVSQRYGPAIVARYQLTNDIEGLAVMPHEHSLNRALRGQPALVRQEPPNE